MIDTLTIATELEEAGLTRSQATAVAHQMRALTESSLASKENLKTIEANLQKEINAVKVEVKTIEANLQKEINAVKVEVKTIEANLQKELRQTSNATIKWVAAMLIGQTALITTLIKVFS
ncbi:MAG: hypothetical protein GDA51_08500 [Ekhidna sp.]|nr:hypothetical protein [Ekhidna sp.]